MGLHGWEAKGVTDGRQALAAVEREPFAAVLMDVRMPGLNGVETFRAMRAMRPDIRVILMTAFAANDLLAEAEREGVLRIFPKPVDVGAVVAMLRLATGRILVVDDDPDYLQTLTDILEEHGFAVARASGLDEALDRLADGPPAVVVLDLHLDAVDPPAAVRAIHQASPGVLFVLYSGHPALLDQTSRAVPASWVRACLQKPFEVRALLEALQ
jgi:DNA-binding NtrC family response regulator